MLNKRIRSKQLQPLIILLVFLFFFTGCSFEATEKAPPFPKQITWFNRSTKFQINYKKLIFLEFLSPDCEPCTQLLPIVENVMKKFPDTVQFIGVLTAIENDTLNPLKAKDYIQQLSINYPIIYDTKAELYHAYNINAWPTIILIKNGEIKKRIYGLQSEEYFKQTLHEIIEGEKI